MATKKPTVGTNPSQVTGRPIVHVDSQSSKKKALTRLERQARRESAQSIRLASIGGGGAGSINQGGGAIQAADFQFYSPQLSTDFLELPQSEREKRELFRFWYTTHPIVGAAVDFHTDVPMSKIRLSLPKGKDAKRNKQILHFYEQMCDRIRLFQTLYDATHEYWLHGNCVAESTLIRTSSGIKQAKDIKVGDGVLTHKGRWKEVISTCSRKAKNLVELCVDGISDPIRMSEHPVEILRENSFQFVQSENIRDGEYARVTWPEEVKDLDSINITDNDNYVAFSKGYAARRKSIRGDRLSNDAVRAEIIGWALSLEEPTEMSCSDLAKKCGVRPLVVTSNVALLADEIGEALYERKGRPGKPGSRTIWYPVKNAPDGWKESAEAKGSFFNQSPNVPINEDFLYLIGAWSVIGVSGAQWTIKSSNREAYDALVRLFGDECIIVRKGLIKVNSDSHPAFNDWWRKNFDTKRATSLPSWVCSLPVKKQIYFLRGIIDSIECGVSKDSFHVSLRLHTAILVRDILFRMGLVPSISRNWGPKNKYDYVVQASGVACSLIERNVKGPEGKSPKSKEINGKRALLIDSIDRVSESIVYNFEVEGDHTYQAGFLSTHNCFIFAEDQDIEIPDEILEDTIETEVGEIDYAGRPVVRKEVTKKPKEKEEQLKAMHKFVVDNYNGWQRLRILPPDQIRLEVFQYTDKVKMELIPSEKDRLVVLRALEQGDEDAEKIADGIPEEIRENLLNGQMIPLNSSPYDDYLCSSFCFHLAHKKSSYDDRGISILERCLRDLLYQDKLRQAQTSIASRAMTPKRVIWAEKMSQVDVEDLRDQVDQALIDPDFSIVTNFEVHWDEIGSRDRLLDLSTEYDITNKRLFIGLRVTEPMLTGESSYSGERIHLDVMNTMYLLYRENLADYVEKFLFAPVAEKKGFIEIDDAGNRVLLYPKLQFTRLALRDNAELQDFMFNLYQKGSLPISYILELLNIDVDDAHAQLKEDLFTPKDATFNELIRGIAEALAQPIVDETDIKDKVIKTLGLKKSEENKGDRFGEDEG